MNKSKGFTLIELLVVIAIIGILSSVVLASLNSARAKGSDAAIKSGLANMRAQAELFYDGAGGQTYSGVCLASTTEGGIADMFANAKSTGADANAKCVDAANSWSASVQLRSVTGFWCVGSSGASRTNSFRSCNIN